MGWSSSGNPPTTATSASESWESVAVEVEPTEIVHVVLDAYQAGQTEKCVCIQKMCVILFFKNNVLIVLIFKGWSYMWCSKSFKK